MVLLQSSKHRAPCFTSCAPLVELLSWRAPQPAPAASQQPTYAVIPPKPRETIDPLPEVPDDEQVTKTEALSVYKEDARSSVQRRTCSELGNVKVPRERSLGEGSKEVGYVWVAGSKILAKKEEEEEEEGYLQANFGRPPLREDKDESHEIVDIPAVSYITSTHPM